MKKLPEYIPPVCQTMIKGVKDAQDVLSGKWKLHIVATLYYRGKMKFMDLSREMGGLAPKILSKELKELELNEILTRTEIDSKPKTVVYELTEHGRSLNKVIVELAQWGNLHREKIMV